MSREAFRDDLVNSGLLEKYYNAEVGPLIQELVRIDGHVKAIIKKHKLVEKHLPKEQQQPAPERPENHPIQILVSCIQDGKIDDPALKTEASDLIRQRAEKAGKALTLLTQYENLLRIEFGKRRVFNAPEEFLNPTPRLIDVVEYCKLNEPRGEPGVFSLEEIKRLDGRNEVLNQEFIKDRFLLLRIDLTHEKEDIKDHCVNAVEMAQMAIGKLDTKNTKGTVSDTLMKQDLFEFLFPRHAIKADTLLNALMRTAKEFADYEVILQDDSLKRRYYYPYLRKQGVENFKQLKKKLLSEKV